MSHTSFKWNVKTDDIAMDFVLDFQIEGGQWRRLRPAQARVSKDHAVTQQDGPEEVSWETLDDFLAAPETPATGANTIARK